MDGLLLVSKCVTINKVILVLSQNSILLRPADGSGVRGSSGTRLGSYPFLDAKFKIFSMRFPYHYFHSSILHFMSQITLMERKQLGVTKF